MLSLSLIHKSTVCFYEYQNVLNVLSKCIKADKKHVNKRNFLLCISFLCVYIKWDVDIRPNTTNVSDLFKNVK